MGLRTKLERFDDWEMRLWAEVNRPNEFEWGRWDCALFVADCVKAMTGFDIASDFRSGYNSEIAAKRFIIARGAESLCDFTDRLFAKYADRIDPAEAKEGDVLVIDTPQGQAGAVHTGGQRVAMVAQDGVMLLYGECPILRAYRI